MQKSCKVSEICRISLNCKISASHFFRKSHATYLVFENSCSLWPTRRNHGGCVLFSRILQDIYYLSEACKITAFGNEPSKCLTFRNVAEYFLFEKKNTCKTSNSCKNLAKNRFFTRISQDISYPPNSSKISFFCKNLAGCILLAKTSQDICSSKNLAG